MGASVTENMLLVGAGFLVIACIFFVLFGFVFTVKVQKSENIFAPFSEAAGGQLQNETAGESGSPIQDLSVLWIALLALSIVVMLMGAKLVYSTYVVEKE